MVWGEVGELWKTDRHREPVAFARFSHSLIWSNIIGEHTSRFLDYVVEEEQMCVFVRQLHPVYLRNLSRTAWQLCTTYCSCLPVCLPARLSVWYLKKIRLRSNLRVRIRLTNYLPYLRNSYLASYVIRYHVLYSNLLTFSIIHSLLYLILLFFFCFPNIDFDFPFSLQLQKTLLQFSDSSSIPLSPAPLFSASNTPTSLQKKSPLRLS